MNKKIIISVIAIILVSLIGIIGFKSKVKDESTNSTKKEMSNVDKDKEENNSKDSEDTQQQPEQKNNIDYKAMYKVQLNNIIEEFGKFDDKEKDFPVKGLKYAELVDFENDKLPELIVIHDMKVKLYKIEDNKVKCAYEGTIGSRHGQRDVAYTIGINDKNKSLIVYNSKKVLVEEVITVVTIKNNKVVTKELYGKSDVEPTNPIKQELTLYSIDGKESTDKEYKKIYDEYITNSRNIDACWDSETASKVKLEGFLSSL